MSRFTIAIRDDGQAGIVDFATEQVIPFSSLPALCDAFARIQKDPDHFFEFIWLPFDTSDKQWRTAQ